MKLKKKLKTKYIAIKRLKIKFDIINKLQDIFYFFASSRKMYFAKNNKKTLF
jgi:hypothetical protein